MVLKIGTQIKKVNLIDNKLRTGVICDYIVSPHGKILLVVEWDDTKHKTTVYPDKVEKI